jgi:hypothetical protein
MLGASKNTTWAWPRISNTRFISRTRTPFTRNNSRFQRHQFIEQTLDEWLKLGVVKRSNSLYNSPIFCVPKKQSQGLRIVQDFRELNQNSHIDKYSMKEITECIGDIGRADSTIFTTLDLTSGFWQMQLDEDSQKLTAFTILGMGQFHWITLPMG